MVMCIANLFEDTSWEYFYEERITSVKPEPTRRILFRFTGHHERNKPELDELTTQWFEQMISSISVVDQMYLKALQEAKNVK